jgi:hypothetical protein
MISIHPTPALTLSRLCLSFVTFVCFCSNAFLPAPSVLAAEIDFENHVAPILSAHCVRCHNREKSRAGLDLSTRAAALKGSDAGEVLVPGRPQGSLLVQRASDGSMPPETDGRRLTADEVAVLSAWVEAGAIWPAGRVLSAPPAIDESNSVRTGLLPSARRPLVARIRHYFHARRNLAAAEERGPRRAIGAWIDGSAGRAPVEPVGERPVASAAGQAEGDQRQRGNDKDLSHGNSP